mgnify:CR=1 FL=1
MVHHKKKEQAVILFPYRERDSAGKSSGRRRQAARMEQLLSDPEYAEADLRESCDSAVKTLFRDSRDAILFCGAREELSAHPGMRPGGSRHGGISGGDFLWCTIGSGIF